MVTYSESKIKRVRVPLSWKKIIGFVFIYFLIGYGCAGKNFYNYKNYIKMTAPVDNYQTHFSDKDIYINFNVEGKKIFFDLTNRTSQPISILWEKAEFTGIDQVSSTPARGMKNLFLSEKERLTTPEPTTIEPKTKLREMAVPAENATNIGEWTWYVKPLFNLEDEKALLNKGKELRLALPLLVNGEERNYNFVFQIYNVSKL